MKTKIAWEGKKETSKHIFILIANDQNISCMSTSVEQRDQFFSPKIETAICGNLYLLSK